MRASRSPGGSVARSPPRDAGRLRRGRPAVLGLWDLNSSARTYTFRVAASGGPEFGAGVVRPLTGYSLRRPGPVDGRSAAAVPGAVRRRVRSLDVVVFCSGFRIDLAFDAPGRSGSGDGTICGATAGGAGRILAAMRRGGRAPRRGFADALLADGCIGISSCAGMPPKGTRVPGAFSPSRCRSSWPAVPPAGVARAERLAQGGSSSSVLAVCFGAVSGDRFCFPGAVIVVGGWFASLAVQPGDAPASRPLFVGQELFPRPRLGSRPGSFHRHQEILLDRLFHCRLSQGLPAWSSYLVGLGRKSPRLFRPFIVKAGGV